MKGLCLKMPWLPWAAAAVLLVGCGEGEGDGTPPDPAPGESVVTFTAAQSHTAVAEDGRLLVELTAADGAEMFLQVAPWPEYGGTYAVSASAEAGTIMGAAADGNQEGVSWYCAAGSERVHWLAAGSARIAAEPAGDAVTLSISGTVTTLDEIEIRFSASGLAVQLPVQPLRFAAHSGTYCPEGGRVDLTLADESGAQMFLSLDVSSGLSGVFTVRHGGGPGTIAGSDGGDTDGASWYASAEGGEKAFLVSGTAEVTFAEGDPMTLTLDGEFTLSGGATVLAEAESLALARMETLRMTIGEIMYYGPNDNGTGLFFLYLKDGPMGEMSHNMGLYVNTEPVADVSDLFIPGGQYVRNPGDTPAYSLNAAEGQTQYNCFWWNVTPELEQFMAVDAGMTVSRSGDIYSIEGFMMTSPYRGVRFEFTGPLPAEDYS